MTRRVGGPGAGLALALVAALAATLGGDPAPARPRPDTAKAAPWPPLPVPRPALPEEPAPGTPPAKPSLPQTVAPATPVPSASQPPAQTCLQRLVDGGASASAAVPAPQPDPACTVADPVRLTALAVGDGRQVALPDAPVIACAMAETFGDFVREALAPLARGTYGSELTAVATGPGLECRPRNHVDGARLSAHGNGLALDIERLTLADGRIVLVGRPAGPQDQPFDRAARAAGCGYFHTELGPGSDSFHATHWHFDLQPRGAKGQSKFCE
ncbi:extensin family protein [Labrys wisconsinensis]|uniref:Extensin-like C-terminal domain-containing protein n=1 Tax=Labrys wisconsinensis TaxID=425677 RepID=A0ABU0JEG0_9HYPH|nr:extensin family protein [Labrys wisconsinensis]MDQ0471527.1 hypothetical protein [Labrys wisconsinensis]